LGFSFLIIAVCLPFWESFDLYNSLLNGKRLFGKYTYYYTYSQLLSFVFLASTIFITKNIITIILVYYISNTLIRILFFYKVTKETNLNDKVDKGAIAYGKHLSLMDVIGTFLGQIDKILVFHYLGAIELALYSIAIAPTEQIKGALKSFHTLALPKFSTRDKADIRASIFQKAIKLGLLVSGVIIVYIILAPYFFAIFFPKYLGAVLYSQILSVSLVGATVSMFLYTYLESHGEKKKLYQFNIFSNLINSLIIFVSIYYFGLWGAIVSRIIIRFLLLIISIVLIKQD
jgi:O-antigen/teichoic acid export membrane protein